MHDINLAVRQLVAQILEDKFGKKNLGKRCLLGKKKNLGKMTYDLPDSL